MQPSKCGVSTNWTGELLLLQDFIIKNADPAVHKEEIHVLYISDKTGNIIQTTDLKITLVLAFFFFFSFFFLSPYFGLKMFHSFPSLIPSQFHFY